MKAGVLALQGAFREHAETLGALGAEPIEVRAPGHLSGIDALFLPGGESTTMSKLLVSSGLFEPLAERGELPVPLFCAGGIATPADASLVMQLGAQAVFVGSGIFKSADPAARAKAIVEATTHFNDPAILAKVSRGLGAAIPGLEISKLETTYADRGW